MIDAFRATAALVPDPLLLVERAGGVIVAVNKPFAELAGAGAVGRALADVCPASREAARDLLAACRRSTGRVPSRLRIACADGSEASLRCVGQLPSIGSEHVIVRFVASSERDAFAVLNEKLRALDGEMKRRLEADARIAEAESGLPLDVRALFDVMPQLGWVARPDGWVYYYNRRFCDYVGRSIEEMQGWGWKIAHDPEMLPAVLERWRASIEAGTAFEMLFRLRRHDGVFRWFVTRATPIRDAGGRVVRWIGINADVDDQKRAEEALEIANRAKDEFLATISHELRTPLNAIYGWTVNLRRASPPPHVDRGLEVIERNARAQAKLIEDVLDLSRIIQGKLALELTYVNVAEIVDAAVDALCVAADAKSLHVGVDVDPSLVVQADADRLQQIVWNLVANAVKFTPKGGSVSVAARRDDSQLTIKVGDTGPGIRPDMLEAIFEAFRQGDASTTRKHGGLGLGLAIVRRLVQAHGGTVSATSEGEGRGSTFTVRLPVRSPTKPPPAPRAPRAGGPMSRLDGLKILVVDDEGDAREMLWHVFESCGADVETAASAAEAFEVFRKFRPDVVVSDVAMPDVDGYAFLRRIRALPAADGGKTPALALTAQTRETDARLAHEAGFQRYLTKPIEPARLASVVARLAAQAALRA